MSKASDRTRRMKAMFGEPQPEHSDHQRSSSRTSSAGAVRSIESSLSQIEQENELLRGQLAGKGHVVELDANLVEASFIRDRLPLAANDPSFSNLVASIRDNGQQVPILVRNHPKNAGRYQVAYGHRRWQAILKLQLPIRAIVSELTDQQMVIALGKENTERKDLSFIEQALFAAKLKEKNYSRDTIAAALSLPPTNVSKITKLVEHIPSSIIDEIGAAPKIGRPRWETLVKEFERLGLEESILKLRKLSESPEWGLLSSDVRFTTYFDALRVDSKAVSRDLFDKHGILIRKISRGGTSTFQIKDSSAPGISEFLERELPKFVEDFLELQREARSR